MSIGYGMDRTCTGLELDTVFRSCDGTQSSGVHTSPCFACMSKIFYIRLAPSIWIKSTDSFQPTFPPSPEYSPLGEATSHDELPFRGEG